MSMLQGLFLTLIIAGAYGYLCGTYIRPLLFGLMVAAVGGLIIGQIISGYVV